MNNERGTEPDDHVMWLMIGAFIGMLSLTALFFASDNFSRTSVGLWLQSGDPIHPSEIIRNYGILVATIGAGFIAIWRAVVADRDNKISRDVHQREIDKIAEDRFQTSTLELSNEHQLNRIGALTAIDDIAIERPAKFFKRSQRALERFCNAREFSKDAKSTQTAKNAVPKDVEMAVNILLKWPESLRKDTIHLRNLPLRWLKIGATKVHNVDFSNSVLSNTRMDRTTIAMSTLVHSSFEETDFIRCTCSSSVFLFASFAYATFFRCTFIDCDLYGVDFRGSEIYESSFVACNFESWVDVSAATLEEIPEFVDTEVPRWVAWADHRPEFWDQNQTIVLLVPEKEEVPLWDRPRITRQIKARQITWKEAIAHFPSSNDEQLG